MNSSLTVVIATFNRSKSLQRCLYSLTRQTDKDFSVLIIDGGSRDKTLNVIERFKKKLHIQVLVDKTPHLAYIRDLGWRKSKSDIVAWIDDDVVVGKQWVETVVAHLGGPSKLGHYTISSIGGVTGPTVVPKKLLRKRDVFYFHRSNKSPIGKFFAKICFSLFMQGEKYAIGKIYPSGAWSPGSNFSQSKKLKKPIEVDYLEACNFAVPRKVLEEVNGFDLNYKGTSEWCEVDLAFRIRKAGYKLLFDPTAAVEHYVSSSGVFARRTNTRARMENFIRFYIRSYYPKTPLGGLQFILYLQFLTFYWLYIFIKMNLSKRGFLTL